ncbi:MAG: N-acetyl-gamma-glutamyl-phosphate reductase [Oscillospiraceae bacterium]|jgi:N-acetyl-gamma-glutamyl-phosphate reductase|nr:N-acetyl-gamma-glutamyl-phosphate reductase [Oscillospiraceae bacterium]
MHKVFIDGSAGTTGLQIEERLRERWEIALLTLPEDLRKDPGARAQRINEADAAILCLPDEAAREAAAMARGETILLDASTAHRTAPGWVYGFPELGLREAIRNSRRIAAPGCHATGFLALARPLIQAGLLPADALLHCFSLTGYTGGGKAMIAAYEADTRAPGDDLCLPRQYALEQSHKHLPEMTAIAGLAQPPVFCPVVVDIPRGMEVTIPLHRAQLTPGVSRGDLQACYQAYYQSAAAVRVVLDPGRRTPISGFGDWLELTVAGNDERLLLVARLDNLGKGAAGAAVQCLNLALGLEETAGLRL